MNTDQTGPSQLTITQRIDNFLSQFSDCSIAELITEVSSTDQEIQRYIPLHINDMLNQCIDQYIVENELWIGNRSLRSGSWSSKIRCLRDAKKEDLSKILKQYEKAYRKVRFGKGTEQLLQKYYQQCSLLTSSFPHSSEIYTSYIPSKVSIVNAVSVETKRGYKVIQLCHANAVEVKSDILALTAQNKIDASPSGFLISTLKHEYNFINKFDQNLLHFSAQEWTNIQKGNNSTMFQNLLTIRVGGPIEEESFSDYMNRIVSGLFASIASLEFLGESVEQIVLPVLQAHRIKDQEDYRSIIKILIQKSVHWLKTSDKTNTINLCVYFGDEINVWSDVMNEVLGRTILSTHKNSTIDSLTKRLTEQCTRYQNGPLRDSIVPLIKILSNSHHIGIEHVAVYGMKLVEAVCKSVLVKYNRKTKGDLISCIERLREGGIAAPWILSYMHNLRILGNEEVHIRDVGRKYIPNSLNENDFVSQLSAIQAILFYWEEMKNQ